MAIRERTALSLVLSCIVSLQGECTDEPFGWLSLRPSMGRIRPGALAVDALSRCTHDSLSQFEGGAGETIRRELLKQCGVHTLLRLPTGIFYAQGVKANVLFFDRKPAAEKPWTEKLWIYDLPPSISYGATGRTNKHFTLNEWSSSEID